VSIAGYALVSAAAAAAPVDPEGVAARIALAVERAGGGQQLAELLGVAKSTVSVLRSGAARPHFDLFARLEAWLATGIQPPTVSRRRARSAEQGLAEATLRRALQAASAPSLRRVAGSIGTTPATLQRTWPQLARAVVLRRRASVLRAGALRRRRLLLAATGSIRALRRSGRPLSRRALEALLGAPGILRAVEVRELYLRATRVNLPVRWAKSDEIEPVGRPSPAERLFRSR
jgi:transcriptional regulator with XRE-family HTH domain